MLAPVGPLLPVSELRKLRCCGLGNPPRKRNTHGGPGSVPCPPASGCGSIVPCYSCDRASITACRPYRSVRSVVATMPSKVSRERKIGRKEQEGGCHVRDRGCVVFSVRPGFFCIMREPRYRSSRDAVSLYLCIHRGRVSIALLWNGDRLEPREGLCQVLKRRFLLFACKKGSRLL